MRPILLIMWTASESFILRDNNNTTCRGGGEHHLCPQNKGQGKTPGLLIAHAQLEIKSATRQIPTTGERGRREPRQDPQIAKSSWPQGRNRGIYHRSLRSKPGTDTTSQDG